MNESVCGLRVMEHACRGILFELEIWIEFSMVLGVVRPNTTFGAVIL